MSCIRVVLADDHAILREGLRAAVNSQPDMKVVAEAATGPAAVEQVQAADPRVLCLDVSMPGWGVATTIERVRKLASRTQVLVVTMHDDVAYARSALTAGANGYVLKSAPVQHLLAAIRRVAAGERVIDPALQDTVECPFRPAGPAGAQQLSRREREVLELLAHGHTHQEVADKLFVSVKTVETYRARIRAKTGLKTRADFVQYGLDTGVLSGPGRRDLAAAD